MRKVKFKKLQIVLFTLVFMQFSLNLISVEAGISSVLNDNTASSAAGISNPSFNLPDSTSYFESLYGKSSDNTSVKDEVYQEPSSVINEVYMEPSSVINAVYKEYRSVEDICNLTEYKADRFIIKYNDDKANAELFSKDGYKTKKVKYLGRRHNSDVVYTKTKKTLKEFRKEIKQKKLDANIKYIQPDYELTVASNDTYYNKQYGVENNGICPEESGNLFQRDISFADQQYNADANVVPGWEKSEGEGIVIAEIDTGVDINHEDLSANIWRNTGEIPQNGIDDDNNGYIDDENGWNFIDNVNKVYNDQNISDDNHGTHIAGIISAVKDNNKGIAGVAPKAKIMPLKVFKNGIAYTSDIIEAINYASQNGARIINCSFGTSNENIALKEALEASNLLVVCAAGNNGRDIDSKPVYPASFDCNNIITVASINRSGVMSGFSNYGQNSIDVAAPGEQIYSTIPGSRYAMSSGTSMSTAFVSGEAALLLSRNPAMSPIQIKERIMSSSDKLSSLINKVNSGNKINCGNALDNIVINQITQINYYSEGSASFPGGDSDDYSLYSVEGWAVRSDMISPREDYGIAKLNNKIYVIGGSYTGSSTYVRQSSVEEYDCLSNTWTAKAGISIARSGIRAAVVNGKIYAMGGCDTNNTITKRVEEYDPGSNTWTVKADMPTERSGFAVAELDGKIYVVGGSANIVEVYDPLTDTWSTKAAITTPRMNPEVVAVSGKLYAIGGHSGNNTLNTVEEYDPTADTWSYKASMPTDRTKFASVTYNNKIYAFGGFSDGSQIKKVEEYNPSDDTWATKIDMLKVKDLVSAAEVNGKIYIIGGRGNTFISPEELLTLRTVEEYTPTSWETKADMPTARAYLKTASLNGKIYAVGGYDNTSTLNSVEQYDPIINTWSTKAGLSTERYNFGLAAANGRLYAMGGSDETNSTLASVEEYNPITDSWAPKLNMPSARDGFVTAVVNGKIYAIGGTDDSNDFLSINEEYNPVTNTWTQKASMPTARRFSAAAAVNGKIYVIGGYGQGGYKTIVEEYDPVTNTWATKASIPVTRGNIFSAEALNGKIYVLGGNISGYSSRVDEFDPVANTWTTVENMPTSRYGLSVSGINGKLYAIGGYNAYINQRYLNGVEEFSPTTIYSLNCTSNKTYNINLSMKYATNFSQRVFTVKYNTDELELTDLCGKTYKKDLTVGTIAGTDITVTHFNSGVIKFTVNKTVSASKAWSGTVNILKFKSKISGQTKVNYYIE